MYCHYFVIISPWKRAGLFVWTNLNLFNQVCFGPSLVKIGLVVLEKNFFFISSMYFHYFVIISPLKRPGPFIWTNWIPFTQGCFVPRLVKIGPVVLEEKIFLISSMYFHYFVIISPWKRAGPFVWTNLNPLHPRMLCAKFGWNWPSGSEEEDENVKSLQTDWQSNRQTTDDRW